MTGLESIGQLTGIGASRSLSVFGTPAPAAATVSAAPAADARRSLDVRVDAATGMTIVTILDSNTGEVVRQIPAEVVLRIAQYLDTELAGQGFVDRKA